MSVKTKMTAIADKIRGLLGLTGTMGLDTMADNLSAAQGEVDTQAELIAQISSVLSGKAGSGSSGGGSANPVLQIKTVTPTKSSQAVKPDSGYDGLSQVNVNAIPSDYIIPSGSKTITGNGTHDVTAFASVLVNVASSGGGLPSGISALTVGTLTPESDKEHAFELQHNLGVTPNVFVLMRTGTLTAVDNADELVFIAQILKPYTTDTDKDGYSMILYTYNNKLSTSHVYGVMETTDTYCTIFTTSDFKLKSGNSYVWLAARLDNLT